MAGDPIYEISSPDVVAEDFGDEIVILNLADGRYFSLPGFAAALWRDIVALHPPAHLLAATQLARPDLHNQIAGLVQAMITARLLRKIDASDAAMAPTGAPSCLEILSATAEIPALHAFDDMAALILADPIHDVVEDVGWPVMRDPT